MKKFKWILKYINIIKWGFAIGLLLVVLKTVGNLALIGLQKFIIDDIFIKGQYDMLAYILTLFAIAIITYNACHALAAMILHKNAFKLNRILSKDLLGSIHQLPTSTIQNERTAKFVHYFTNDVERVSRTIASEIPEGLQHLLSIAVLSIIIGWASPVILVLVVVLSIIYVLLGKHFGPILKLIARRLQDKKSNLLVHIEEGISSTREVVAYNRLEWEKERYNRSFADYFNQVKEEGKTTNKQMIYGQTLKWIATLLILSYGGYLVITGHLTLGMFVITYQFSTQLMDSFQSLYEFLMRCPGSIASVERLEQVMHGESWGDGKVGLTNSIERITLSGLSFKYPGTVTPVLDGLSADLPVRSKIGVVGMSGSGKSTIAQLLVRSFNPEKGRILVNNTPLLDIKRSDWANKVMIVFQEPYFYPDTILENLLLGRESYSMEAVIEACKLTHIHEYIETLDEGYHTVIGERGILLSGGQRQRLSLARALLSNPEVLIIDEGTSALDLETERQVLKNIDERRKGLTTIVIAHRLSTIQNSDLILVMDQGKVVEAGTHDQLKDNGSIYRKLISIQSY